MTRAFTLIELLVVVAILAILVAILLPSLGRARGTASLTRELAAARSLSGAWSAYADDNAGAVLPGYASAQLARDLDAFDASGARITGPAAQRYPWRLAPTLDHELAALYQDPRALRDLRDEPLYTYVVSLFPLLGVNAQFVGGHADYLAFDPRFDRRFGRFYLKRLDETIRPSRLIVFASARAPRSVIDGLDDAPHIEGYHQVLAPRFDDAAGPRWGDTYDPSSADPGRNSGFVAMRFLGRATTSAVDGHAESLGWDDLRDMTRWANLATDSGWGLVER